MKDFYFATGGTLPQNAPSYIPRQADTDLYETLKQSEFCYVLTSRQMGKSSLMVRVANRLREEDNAVVVFELTAIGINVTVEQWYEGLMLKIGEQLDLADELDDFWYDNEQLGPLQRLMQALRQIVLPTIQQPVVIFFDEIDVVRSLPFSTDEFFAAIRECYNARTQEPNLQRLTFCLIGVATPSDLIADPRITPFNIGKRIDLTDFTENEAALLAQGLQRNAKQATALLKRILYWTNGHPYLTQKLCQIVADDNTLTKPAGVDRLCEELFFSSRSRDTENNLQHVRTQILDENKDTAALLDLYRQVRSRKKIKDDDTNGLINTLRLSGLVRIWENYLWVRNRIYFRVFDKPWINNNMPDAEKRRQKAALIRGWIQAGTVTTIVIFILYLLGYMLVQTQISETQVEKKQDEVQFLQTLRLIELAGQETSQGRTTNGVLLALEALPTNTAILDEIHKLEGIFYPDPWERIRKLREGLDRPYFVEAEIQLSFLLPNHHEYLVITPKEKVVEMEKEVGVAVIEESATEVEIEKDLTTENVIKKDFNKDIVKSQNSNDTTACGIEITTVLDVSPDSTKLVGTVGEEVFLWNIHNGQLLLVLEGHTDTVRDVSFSPDDRQVATASDDKTVLLWDIKNGQLKQIFKGHGDIVRKVVFSPNGQQIATVSNDKTARLWDVNNGKLQQIFKGHEDIVRKVVFSPNGQTIATVSDDKTVRLWDINNDQLQQLFTGCTNIVFSPNGQQIAIVSDDKTVRLWNVENDQLQQVLRGHSDIVRNVVFSSGGQQIATASDDKTARLWDVDNGQLRYVLEGHTDIVRNVVFSPDNQQIATISDDRTARLWAVNNGQLLKLLKEKENENLLFSPFGFHNFISDPKYLRQVQGIISKKNFSHAIFNSKHPQIITVFENLVQLWDTNTYKLLAQRYLYDSVSDVIFSPDGKKIAMASGNKIHLWTTLHVNWLNMPNKYRQFRQSLSGHSFSGRAMSTKGNGSFWQFFSSTGEFIDYAYQVVPRCLTSGQRKRLFLPSDPSYDIIEEGKKLAKQGNIKAATAKFKEAKAIAPCHKFLNFPEDKAREIAAMSLIEKGKELARKGQVEEAIEQFKQAQQVDGRFKFGDIEDYAQRFEQDLTD
jgi:WD40 repeat protein